MHNESKSLNTSSTSELEKDSLAEIGASAPIFAHAVANPLGGISTSIQLLRKHFTDHNNDELAADLLDACSGEVARLTSLLNEFRSLSRPIRLQVDTVDLVKIIREGFKSAVVNHRISVEVSEEYEELPAISADAEKLVQVVHETCRAAVDAMPQGGRLMFRARKMPGCVLVEIGNTGIGHNSGEDIFEPFKTPAGARLAIARRIVRAHGGTIRYSSESGKGTTFQIVLPL